MQRINEFITYQLTTNEQVQETCCIASQNDSHVNLRYLLLNSDCLINFSGLPNTISINISHSYFEKYDEPFELIFQKQSICCNTQSKLHEFAGCTLAGLAKNIFLESIVLHLLFQLQKNSLSFSLQCDTCSFLNKPLELDKIYKAKTFINQNLSEPLTIPVIALHAGTNQCYLKRGFKEVTSQTIFEYIQENRMVKAKHLLHDASLTVADVAVLVGYASASSFSQTFKNFFGFAPSQVQRKDALQPAV